MTTSEKTNHTNAHTIKPQDQFFAQIALANKMIDKKQLLEAIEIQKQKLSSGFYISLANVLLELKLLTQSQIQDLDIATKRKFGKILSALAVKKGLISAEQSRLALETQAQDYKENRSCDWLGEILVDQGAFTNEQYWQLKEEIKNQLPHLKPTNPEGDQKIGDFNLDAEKPQLIVTDDKLEAYIRIAEGKKSQLSVLDVKETIEENHITFGILEDEKIEEWIENDEENTQLQIAKGISSVQGSDGSIKYYFQEDYKQAGTVHQDGVIDYRERGEIPWVNPDDLLAEKIPAKAGKEGKNIFGQAIFPNSVFDIAFQTENGTKLSEDGLKVYATISGRPNLTIGGKISVLSEFKVDGDVDYSIGNIEFEGDIIIKGSIHEGFFIKGANIAAKEIANARIHSKGDVHINGGIIHSQIEAEGSIYAKFITGSNIKAYGDIVIEKEIRDTKIRTSGACKVERGTITASLVVAKQGVFAKNIGNDYSNPCTLKAGMDDHIRKITQGFITTGKDLKTKLEELQLNYEQLNEKKNKSMDLHSRLIATQENEKTVHKQLLEKKKKLARSIDPKEKERISLELTAVYQKIENSVQNINKISEGHDIIETQIDKIKEYISDLIQKIETNNAQKEAAIKWSEKRPAISKVQATKSLFGKTKIFFKHTSIQIQDDIKAVTVQEVLSSEAENKYQIKLIPVKL